MDKLLNLAIFVSLATYLAWDYILETIGIPVFYIGNAFFIFLLCLFIWMNHKKYAASFILLCISTNNLLDETLFDNTKIGLNEYFFAIILAIITYLRYYARKNKLPE